MDWAQFQQAWGVSAPVLFNQQGQQGDNPESIALGDSRTFHAPGFVTPPGASLPPNPEDIGFQQSPGVSLLMNPINHAGFSGFVTLHGISLPPSPAYIDFQQSPDASLTSSPANYALSDFGEAPCTPAYMDLQQFPGASLTSSPANHTLSGFEGASSTCLPSWAACTSLEQLPGGSVPPGSAYDLNHPVLSVFEEAPAGRSSTCIRYRSLTNIPSLPQPQSHCVGISQAILLNSTHRECRYPANEQNFEQIILPIHHESNTVHQVDPRRYDNSNHVPSDFEQILGPVVNSRAKPRSCLRCRELKRLCTESISDKESRCLRCVDHGIPAPVCKQDPDITRFRPFDRCSNEEYKLRCIYVRTSALSSPRTAQLGHYPNGPTLDVECCEFLVTEDTDITKTSVVRKNRTVWSWMDTTPYRVKNLKIDISPYLQKCTRFSIDEACRRQYPISFFFRESCNYKDNPIIEQCFELYKFQRLIRIGWQFRSTESESESLGMLTVTEKSSIFYRLKCVPGIVQNQLNHPLELKMMELDQKILNAAKHILKHGERRMWIVGFLALVFLLHIREVHGGRIIYWSRHDLGQFWDHPSSPTTLIEEVIASCNSILSHFHCLGWAKPLYMNWDDQKSKDMVGNDSKVVDSMKALQAHVSKLREKDLIGKKACNLYVDGDPNSVEFTVVSLLFVNLKEGCEVEGFS